MLNELQLGLVLRISAVCQSDSEASSSLSSMRSSQSVGIVRRWSGRHAGAERERAAQPLAVVRWRGARQAWVLLPPSWQGSATQSRESQRARLVE